MDVCWPCCSTAWAWRPEGEGSRRWRKGGTGCWKGREWASPWADQPGELWKMDLAFGLDPPFQAVPIRPLGVVPLIFDSAARVAPSGLLHATLWKGNVFLFPWVALQHL